MATTKDCVAFIVAWLRANPNALPIEPSLARLMDYPEYRFHSDRFKPWLWKRVSKKKLPNGDTLRVFHASVYCYLFDLGIGLTEDTTGALINLEHGPLKHFYDKYGVRFTDRHLAKCAKGIAPMVRRPLL